MGQPTATINKQKSQPCALWHTLNSQWNSQGKSLSSNFPPKVSSTLQLPEWFVPVRTAQRLLGRFREMSYSPKGTCNEGATVCDLMPKTAPHVFSLFGKLISRTLGKQNQELKLPLSISSVQTKNQINKPIVCLTCSIKISQLLMLNSWVPEEPVFE